MLVLLPNVPENDQRGLESWKAVLWGTFPNICEKREQFPWVLKSYLLSLIYLILYCSKFPKFLLWQVNTLKETLWNNARRQDATFDKQRIKY